MIVKSVVAVLVLILSVLAFIIIKNWVYWRIRNWWDSTFIHLPSLSAKTEHYVRVIRTSQASELICGIENGELHIPVNNGEELVYSVTIDEDDNNNKYLKLREKDDPGKQPIPLHLHRPYDLKGEQMRLIYVNIKTYGKN